jgi:DNA-binding CsgD family transcriptional regulator
MPFEAMRETPVAERRMIIRSERKSDGRVRVSVRDFGTGLPAEEPERIFERFFSTKREGMGMGLAIARSIIASHGGELAAANAQGGGACVHFSLPVVRARLAKLTPREFEVFRLVIAGLLNKEIGAELGVALRTIKTHRARVMQKMGVVSVAELVRLAQKAGVAPAPLRWKAARLPFS